MRKHRTLGMSLCAVMTATAWVQARPPHAPTAAPAGSRVTPGTARTTSAYPEELGRYFTNWSVQSLDLPEAPRGAFTVEIKLAGQSRTLYLAPYSLRDPDFTVWSYDDRGDLAPTTVEAPKTYRGFIEETPDSAAGGSLVDGGLTAVIEPGVGQGDWTVEPLSRFIDGAARNLHVIYHENDVIYGDNLCGMDDAGVKPFSRTLQEFSGNGDEHLAGVVRETDVAIDADFDYFTKSGGTIQQTLDNIEGVIAGVDAIYQNDVQICWNITTILVRDAEPDPYTSTSPTGLLNQFINEWNGNQSGRRTDHMHLFTGKSLDGSVIGIANCIGCICSATQSYALSEAMFRGSSQRARVALVSHEIGHVYGAPHCCSDSSCPDCYIMCPSIGGCAAIFDQFAASSIARITTHRNSRSCLDDCGEEIPCEDVKKLGAKCKGDGTIKFSVVMTSDAHDGRTVRVAVDDTVFDLTVNGKKAKGDVCCYSGDHAVSLERPAGCVNPKTVSCG